MKDLAIFFGLLSASCITGWIVSRYLGNIFRVAISILLGGIGAYKLQQSGTMSNCPHLLFEQTLISLFGIGLLLQKMLDAYHGRCPFFYRHHADWILIYLSLPVELLLYRLFIDATAAEELPYYSYLLSHLLFWLSITTGLFTIHAIIDYFRDFLRFMIRTIITASHESKSNNNG